MFDSKYRSRLEVYITGYMSKSCSLAIHKAGQLWVELDTDDPKSTDDVIGVTANQPSRFVGRLFYKGLYLPGWGQKKKAESKV